MLPFSAKLFSLVRKLCFLFRFISSKIIKLLSNIYEYIARKTETENYRNCFCDGNASLQKEKCLRVTMYFTFTFIGVKGSFFTWHLCELHVSWKASLLPMEGLMIEFLFRYKARIKKNVAIVFRKALVKVRVFGLLFFTVLIIYFITQTEHFLLVGRVWKFWSAD